MAIDVAAGTDAKETTSFGMDKTQPRARNHYWTGEGVVARSWDGVGDMVPAADEEPVQWCGEGRWAAENDACETTVLAEAYAEDRDEPDLSSMRRWRIAGAGPEPEVYVEERPDGSLGTVVITGERSGKGHYWAQHMEVRFDGDELLPEPTRITRARPPVARPMSCMPEAW